VDFGPYLQDVIGRVRQNWYQLIPESASTKKGTLAIEFAITKDGKVADMRLVATSGDVALERPAWGGITASNPFPPLPSEFTGPFLALRIRFYYNPDKRDLQDTQEHQRLVQGAQVKLNDPGTPSQPPANSVPKQEQQSAGGTNNSFSKYAAGMSAGSAIQQAAQAAANHTQGAVSNHTQDSVEILSDTLGIDFGPYIQRIIQEVRAKWFSLIPVSDQMKKGNLAIQFDIAKDGKVADMRLVASSGDKDLDRSAWGSITASNPFPPLPSEFTGPYLALRFRFYYNPDKSDLDGSAVRPNTRLALISALPQRLVASSSL
jgi:TonB family protein